MAERYTNCDIEVHLCNVLEGMPLEGLDEDESLTCAQATVIRALGESYPEHSVHVHMDRHTYGPTAIAAYPDEVDPEEIRGVVEDALGNYDAWFVQTGPASERPEFPVYYDAQGREHAEF